MRCQSRNAVAAMATLGRGLRDMPERTGKSGQQPTSALEKNLSKDLMPLIKGYLESDGFRILDERSGFLVADKLIFAQERDTRLIWTIPADQEIRHYEATLRGSISMRRANYPDAKAYVVAESRSGFSRDLLQTLSDQRVHLRVPIQFFDTDFKLEDGMARAARSAISDILEENLGDKRVMQPYRSESTDGQSIEGADLFSTLVDELTNDQGARVRIVVGRAGIGKSSLFNALFARLYDQFKDAKLRLATGRRPIPMVVRHMRDVVALRTELLVENFLRLDVAQPLSRDTFEWLLANGFTTWLMDGLDELYGGDPHFFDYLGDLLTRSTDSKAQITLFCRDSLMTTSSDFQAFRDLISTDKSLLKIYHLAEWERHSKRDFAWINLEGRKPQRAEVDTAPVEQFMNAVEGTPTISALSGLPFYCWILLQNFNDGTLEHFEDDVAMLDHFVDRMLTREVEKGLLDLRVFEENGLQDWLEDIAVRYFEDGYVDQEEAVEYGKIVLRDGVSPETQEHVLVSLLHFPLFVAGSEGGRISFAHDLLAEVLAARGYLRLLRRAERDSRLANRLSRVDLADPTILRFIARRMGAADAESVLSALRDSSAAGHGFAVLLALLMMARPEMSLLKDIALNLERRDLTALTFARRDLSGLSLRGSDLTTVRFDGCNLRGTMFEGAVFNLTRFVNENVLSDARFGGMGHIDSLYAGRRLLDDPRHIQAWIAEVTGLAEEDDDSCPTAMQIRSLFGKFITPLGQPRRDNLKLDALVAGKHFEGAPPGDECVKAAVSHAYLDEPDHRDRLRRAAGDKYAEMIRLVRDGAISDGLGRLVSDLCARPGCAHRL